MRSKGELSTADWEEPEEVALVGVTGGVSYMIVECSRDLSCEKASGRWRDI